MTHHTFSRLQAGVAVVQIPPLAFCFVHARFIWVARSLEVVLQSPAQFLASKQVKAAIGENLVAVLCDPSKSVGQLLEGLSCVAHLLLVLFRVHRTGVMTGQLYHDTQATIRGIFYCVLKVQEHSEAMATFLWQIGTDLLENLFAVVRTLTNARNVDGKELGDRLGAAVTLEEIYCKHPGWAKTSRRLTDSCDHMNVETWKSAGPTDSCNVRVVDVPEQWNEGRRKATAILQAHEEYTDVTAATFEGFEKEGITMFFPFG